MIRGIGVDVVSVPRISDLIRKYGGRFTHRWLTVAEINEGQATARLDQHIATCLATKEAVFKSLDLDRQRAVPWRQIEVLGPGTSNSDVRLHGALSQLETEIERFIVSSSCSGEVATAFVIAVGIRQ